jgi:hypothetical protein
VTSDPARNYRGCPRAVRSWIGRALHFEPRLAFRSAGEAARALTVALREDASCRPSAAAVQRFLASCSYESLAPAPAFAEYHVSGSGAVVSVRAIDRGSGAHRISRQPADPTDRPSQTLADFSVGAEHVVPFRNRDRQRPSVRVG